MDTTTPRRKGQLVQKLGDSARKLEQMENSQKNQVGERIERQLAEIEAMENELAREVQQKTEHMCKLMEVNQKIRETVKSVLDGNGGDDHEAIALIEKNDVLMDGISKTMSEQNEHELEKSLSVLQIELENVKERQMKATPVTDVQTDQEEIDEVRQTLKILKERCDGIEAYARNSVKFQTDERKSRIKRLERTLASLNQELKNVTNPSVGSLDSPLCAITSICDDMYVEITRKDKLISDLTNANELDQRRLEMLNRRALALEDSIKGFQVGLGGTIPAV